METKEVADQISELVEEQEARFAAERAERAAEQQLAQAREQFRQRAALTIAGLAMLLAICHVGAGNATEDIISKNIEASDTWAFYQAKNIRQTEYRVGADVLDALLAGGAINESARPAVEGRIGDYRATIDRCETEPKEGKQDLATKARHLEEERDRARLQDANFDISETLFQIGIVLGSVAILATSRIVLGLAVAFGAVATLFMINAFFLLVLWQHP